MWERNLHSVEVYDNIVVRCDLSAHSAGNKLGNYSMKINDR